ITKADLDPEGADRLVRLYTASGFETMAVSAVTGTGVKALQDAAHAFFPGRVSCLCGASGVGKSTLRNLLFPNLNRKTGEISLKNRRGRNTTREITLFDLSVSGYPDAWLADTPGFTMLDFEQFDFMRVEDLFDAFPEFDPYFGKCRYQDCAHVKEEGCAVLEAVNEGRIPKTRHESYAELYGILKKKKPWTIDSGSGRA
ncbi:MAG: ribosome small subunit-dependent GTPase A, partial [Clostridia bacterium]|nr:ribosome small subunit-dependent GTPase A [Clostridia bacterium]